MARSTWQEAKGGYVTNEHLNKDGTVTPIRTYRAPDKTCRTILFDHLLGKPKPQTQAKDDSRTPKAPPIHEKVEQALTGHLNELAEESHVDGDSDKVGQTDKTDKTISENSISERLRILGLSKDKPEGS